MDITYPYEKWPESLKSERFEKLFSIEDPDTLSKPERQKYDRWLKEYRDIQNCLDTAYEQSYQESYQEGVKLAREEIVIRMTKLGYSINLIAKGINCSLDEVIKIQKANIASKESAKMKASWKE